MEALDVPGIEEVEAGSMGSTEVGQQLEQDETAKEGNGDDSTDNEMRKIEKEKEGLSAIEILERALAYKVEGNDCFRNNDIFKAADCYYRAVLYGRDLMRNPKHYPKLGHTEAQREIAQGLVESVFCNLSLVQSKYGLGLPRGAEREKVLREGAKSAGEALKVNANNVKALYRRGLCRAHLARDFGEAALAGGSAGKLKDAQELCTEAKADLMAAIRQDEKNRDARAELKAMHELMKHLKQEELSRDKREFSFKNSLSALQSKEEDALGDGTVRKQQVLKSGDGAQWYNQDWLMSGSRQRCVVHVRCRLLGHGGSVDSQLLIFALSDPDMHEGIRVAARSMSKGELARFVLEPKRLASKAPLARRLPEPPAEASCWEVELLKFAVYEDQLGDGSRLLKVISEGYGRFPELFAECHLHWKVTGPDDKTLHSSRHVVSIGGVGGIQQTEDPDRAPYVYTLGETMWAPVEALCKVLRQGGHAELRLKHAPDLPDKDPGAPMDAVSAQLGAALSKRTAGGLHDCAVHVELDRVVQPLQGPEDPNWCGVASLVEERFRAEQLLGRGADDAALRRFRRACEWSERLLAASPSVDLGAEQAALRAGLAWVLAKRAAPILDLGTVSSDVTRAAEADLAEAEAHCDWLDAHHPGLAGARLVRAKILVARDDDFVGAQRELLEAQRLAPQDVCVQQELKTVRVELRREQEAKSREKVSALREGLAAAREEGLGLVGSVGELKAAELLSELAVTQVSWEVVMDTRVGAELKRVQELSGDPVTKKLCSEIIGRWMDEAKEQRPMWEK